MQDPFGQLLGRGDVVSQREGVAAAHGGEEDVLVPPEHALGYPGRSPGVDAVEIVGAARGEIADGRR
jgi:hypothetical protein